MICAVEIKEGTAIIKHCHGYGGAAEVPETVAGFPVAALSPYAFSDQVKNKSGLNGSAQIIWDADAGKRLETLPSDIPPAHGKNLESIVLPETLIKIGAYAFYNCTSLKSLTFYGALKDLGAGVFSGCRSLDGLTVKTDGGEESCLKEMLQEIHQELCVNMYLDGKKARLIFPAYFEEVVENTPARVFSTEMHGSGKNYRYSFDGRKFSFSLYDSCFKQASKTEEIPTLLKLALGRLMYPAGLSTGHKALYEAWLYENIDEAVDKIISSKDMEALYYITANEKTAAGKLRIAARRAAEEGFPEGASLIMEALSKREEKHPSVGIAKKRFEL